MSQLSIFSYFFRALFKIALFICLAMLYWSSILVEERLQEIKVSLNKLDNNFSALPTAFAPCRQDLPNEPFSSTTEKTPNTSQKSPSLTGKNLLVEDLYYSQTLPQLLGPNFKPSGTKKMAELGKPDNLHPFNGFKQVSEWHQFCSVGLADLEVGKYESYTPAMALRIEKQVNENGEEYWIKLRKDLFWQPLEQKFFDQSITLDSHFLHPHPVTASDYKFFYDAIMNPHLSETGAVAYRGLFAAIESVEVIDNYTLKVKWKTNVVEEEGQKKIRTKYLATALTCSMRPLASFVYQYFSDGQKIIEEETEDTYRSNPIWAQNFSNHWAKNIIPSCGPWLFDGFSDKQICFKRNPNFYEPYAALSEKMNYLFKNSIESMWEEFKQGNLDFLEISPQQISEYENFIESAPYQKQVQQGLKIHRLDYIQKSYAYIGWNESSLLFNSFKVRQALTLAIDRKRIIRQNLNGLGIEITGPFFLFSPSYDASLKPYPYDPEKALQLLHEEGWYDSDGDGILDRVIDGKTTPFRFKLTYFVKNSMTKAICEYVATALKEIGIHCQLNGVEAADLSAIFADKNFDAYTMMWGLVSPPEDPRQLWHSAGAKEKGSSNAIGFANQEIDSIIEKLDYENSSKDRLKLYHRFDKIIHEQAPYLFLYTPKKTLLYRDYVKNVFIPVERQDLIPGAREAEPIKELFWIAQ